MASVAIPIFDDEVAECLKEFFLDLEIPPAAAVMGVIKESPDTAVVRVADEDSEFCQMHCVCFSNTQPMQYIIEYLYP